MIIDIQNFENLKLNLLQIPDEQNTPTSCAVLPETSIHNNGAVVIPWQPGAGRDSS